MGKLAKWRRLRGRPRAGRGPRGSGGRGSLGPEGPGARRPPGRAGTRRGARRAAAGPRSLLRSAPEAAGWVPRASRSRGAGARASAAPGSGPSGDPASGKAAAALVGSGRCVRARRREPECVRVCVCVCRGVRVRARGGPARAGGPRGAGAGCAEARPSSVLLPARAQPPGRAASRRVPGQLARRPRRLPLQTERGPRRTRRAPGGVGGAEGRAPPERRWGRSLRQVSAAAGGWERKAAARAFQAGFPESACSHAGLRLSSGGPDRGRGRKGGSAPEGRQAA